MPANTTNFLEGGVELNLKYLSANDVVYVADSFLSQLGIYQKYGGGLWTWGLNSNGQLGLSDITHRSSPVQVGSLTNWYQISSGLSNSAAIKTDGTLWTWGNNTAGQLGLGNTTSISSPVQVGSLTNWKEVSATTSRSNTDAYALAIKTDGTLWSWGGNSLGQLGLGNITNVSSPVQVGLLTNWSKIAIGAGHSLAIKTDGTLWVWGLNGSRQLGLGVDNTNKSSPVQLGALTTWSQIAAGDTYSIAISNNGTIWSWGSNNNGQLGLGVASAVNISTPVQIGSLTNWSSVACSSQGTTSIKTDGTLWSWGLNGNGQLGLGDTTSRSSPVQVGLLTNWSKVATSTSISVLAIKTDGTLWSWGRNTDGQLGLGDITHRSSPVQVGSLTNRVQASSYSAIRK